MKALLRTKIAAVTTVMALGLFATAAQAALASWSDTANGPTIYQTNRLYNSSWMNAPAGIPSTAKVTKFYYFTYPSYFPVGMYIGICPSDAGGGCYWKTSQSGSVSPSDNRNANQSFRFGFYVSQATNHMFTPPISGYGHQLSVNYAY